MTVLLDENKVKSASKVWLDPFDHTYHKDLEDGETAVLEVPSVTEVVDGNELRHSRDLFNIPKVKANFEAKGDLGTDVHTAIRFLILGKLDWDTVDDTVRPYVVAAESFLSTCSNFQATELSLFSSDRQYTGTLDLLCERYARPTIADFKIRAAKDGDGDQLAGCAQLVQSDGLYIPTEWRKKWTPALIGVELTPSGGYVPTEFDYLTHREIFNAALTVWWTRRARKLI
jgi:hypothetical protein